MIDDEF